MDATLTANNAMETTEPVRDEKTIKEKTSKNMLWLGIISIIMMFGGLTSAVIVSKGGNFWVNMQLPQAFWISSAVIVLSSVTMSLSKMMFAKNNIAGGKNMLAITLVLGLAFGYFQFEGYKQLVDNGYFLTARVMDDEGKFIPKGEYGKDFTVSWRGEVLSYESGLFFMPNGQPLSQTAKLKLMYTRNNASSFLYFLSFLHLLHMLGGIIYLIVVTTMAYRNKFSSANFLKIKLSTIYWHFLGVLWIYLFVFLQYIH